METNKQTTILILEDNLNERKEFEICINKKSSYTLIAQTASSIDALELVKATIPNVVIVDLELHDGVGSGILFLDKLKSLTIKVKPFVVVTTNIKSETIYNKIHNNSDLIFWKKQAGYSPNFVLEVLSLVLKDSSILSKSNISEQIIQNRQEKIINYINSELDNIGINYKLKGRIYIYEGLLYLLSDEQNDNSYNSVFQYLAQKYKLHIGSIGRAIQTAINEAWRTSSIEDLQANYTAKINYHTGVPSPTEFICYYHQKISKLL